MISVVVDVCPKMAVKAGKSAHGRIAVQLDPEKLEQWQRDELAAMHYRDGAFEWPHTYTQPKYAEATAEAAHDLLAKSRAERVRAKAQREEHNARRLAEAKDRVRDWLAQSDEDLIVYMGGWQARDMPRWPVDTAPDEELRGLSEEAKQRHSHLRKLAEERESARLTAEREKRARTEAEAREKRAAYERALDAFAAEHLSDVQKERRKRGLMTEDELLKLVRDYVFAAVDNLANVERYKRVSLDDCMEIETEAAESVDDYTMRIIMAIEADMRDVGGKVEARDHIVTSYGEEEARWQTLLVTVDWHGRPLSREYSVLHK